jgi:predicted amidohydrolase
MKVFAVQFDIAWEDKAENHRRIERMLEEAEVAPGTFVLLPELGDTGFSFNIDAIVDDRSLEWARATARGFGVWLQHGYPVPGSTGKGRNRASIVSPDGEVVGSYDKVHPFTYGRGEQHHYDSGSQLTLRGVVGLPGEPVICPLICYDLRFPELWRLAALAGAEVFTIGASWPNARQAHWRALLIARAIENQAYVIAVNRTGADPYLKYAGGSIIVSPKGEVLAEADDEPSTLDATLNLEALRAWRHDFKALSDAHRDLLGTIAIDEADR